MRASRKPFNLPALLFAAWVLAATPLQAQPMQPGPSPGQAGPGPVPPLAGLLLDSQVHTALTLSAAQEAQQKTAAELVQSQATVGMLRNLLPLCAWCKKIRNEADGWDDLETYILNYSKAQFTHSVCPDCAAGVLLGADRSRA